MSFLDKQIKCIKRELALRARVYPRLVKQGKMSQELADREVLLMGSVLDDLRERKNAILVWSSEDLPKRYKDIVKEKGGSLDDMDWAAFVPGNVWDKNHGYISWAEGEGFSPCGDVDKYTVEEGVILIGRHS